MEFRRPPPAAVFGVDMTDGLNTHVANAAAASSPASPVFALEDGLAFMSFAAQVD